MYTQCPECQIAFRVTIQVLQKAGGRVRCGGCSHAFSAIDYLTEDLPTSVSDTPTGNEEPLISAPEEDDLAKKNKALLDTLDELAGPENVRLEDTGIEWRLLDEIDEAIPARDVNDDAQSMSDPDPEEKPAPPAATEQRRYDDNSPLPDDFEEEDETPYSPPLNSPKRRATDREIEQAEFDTQQVELALGGDEDWSDLLDDDADLDKHHELARQLEEAEAQQLADDSALLPQLAADVFAADDESATADIPLEEEAAGEEKVAESEDDIETPEIRLEEFQEPDKPEHSSQVPPKQEPSTADIRLEELEEPDEPEELPVSMPEPLSGQQSIEDLDTQFNLQAEAMGLEITRNGDLEASPELATDELASANENDGQAKEVEATEDKSTTEENLADSDFGSDELTPEEEADIVEKLRESTGAFQRQIESAQRALERGEIDEYQAPEKEGDSDSDGDLEKGYLYEETGQADNEDADDDESDALTDKGILSQSMIQAGFDPSLLDSENVESIVMEGEFAGDSSDSADIADLEGQASLVDTYMLNKDKVRGGRRESVPTGYSAIVGVVALLVLLAAQYIHASRQTFATYGTFNQTLSPLYSAIGQPITPQWNIKGWKFERTNGNTDETGNVLTVLSQIKNDSDQPLPYPLVHVSLTDRWEEVVGSKILEPADYLAGDLDPDKQVAPGDSFKAVIAIEGPSADATGFKLYVCYRVQPGRVRCATEDFKR